MNYFDIYFYSQGFHKILEGTANQGFINDFNTKEVKPLIQAFTNFLFNQWVLSKKLNGKDIYDRKFNILSRTDFPDISDDLFEMLNNLTLKRDFMYISNWFFDKEEKNPYFKLFDFSGIINSLNNLESDPHVFYINKFHIVNIIDTYLLGKFIDYYLRECAPTKDKRKYESTNKHYFEKVLIKALTYKSKEIDTYSDSFKKTEAKLTENEFYENKKALMSSLISYSKEIAQDEFKRDALYNKCLIDLRNFRVEVLHEICKYLITEEELEDNAKLFTMTHRKRLLLYDLLRNIEPEKKLPPDEDAFRERVTSDKKKADSDKSLIHYETFRFVDFKRDEVKKHFG